MSFLLNDFLKYPFVTLITLYIIYYILIVHWFSCTKPYFIIIQIIMGFNLINNINAKEYITIVEIIFYELVGIYFFYTLYKRDSRVISLIESMKNNNFYIWSVFGFADIPIEKKVIIEKQLKMFFETTNQKQKVGICFCRFNKQLYLDIIIWNREKYHKYKINNNDAFIVVEEVVNKGAICRARLNILEI